MHLPAIVSDLALTLLVAAVLTVAFRLLHLPTILAYIVTGFLLGPLFPFFTLLDVSSFSDWSEIGIIMLLFVTGLEFNIPSLRSIRSRILLTTSLLCLGTIFTGYLVGKILRWSAPDCFLLGAMLAMNAATIVIKAIEERGEQKTLLSRTLFAVLVAEDLVGVVLIALLEKLASPGFRLRLDLLETLGIQFLWLALYVVIGIWLLPSLFNKLESVVNDELLLLASLAVCFGSVFFSHELGFSIMLGAFLGGTFLSGTLHSRHIVHLTHGIKEFFGAIVHISVGMMISPDMLRTELVPILVLSVVTLIAKFLFGSLGLAFSGFERKDAIKGGLALSQVGEIAFIVAAVGRSLGILRDELYSLVVGVSVFTTLATPLLVHRSGEIAEKLARFLPLPHIPPKSAEGPVFRRESRALYSTFVSGSMVILLGFFAAWGQLPLLRQFGLGSRLWDLLLLAAIYLVLALFIHSLPGTKSRSYADRWKHDIRSRPRMVLLVALQLCILLAAVSLPLFTRGGAKALLLLPAVFVLMWLAAKIPSLSSLFAAETARFSSNLREQQLRLFSDSAAVSRWLDRRFYVTRYFYSKAAAALDELHLSQRFHVRVIRIAHGAEETLIPGEDTVVYPGDVLWLIGEEQELDRFLVTMGSPTSATIPLHRFLRSAEGYEFLTIPRSAEGSQRLIGRTIHTIDAEHCGRGIVLGLQRRSLPISSPSPELIVRKDDILWILEVEKDVSALPPDGS